MNKEGSTAANMAAHQRMETREMCCRCQVGTCRTGSSIACKEALDKSRETLGLGSTTEALWTVRKTWSRSSLPYIQHPQNKSEKYYF